MKLLTWNSAMRFRDKIENIIHFEADILVIPECESPGKWNKSVNQNRFNQFLWFGDKVNKGLGIFTMNDLYRMELHPSYNKDFRYIIPIKVSGKENFLLFAVWAQNTKNRFDSYIGQIYLALEYYKPLLEEPCILSGDWNSNKIFDHIKRVGTHTTVVDLLSALGIHSLYHEFYKEEQGLESMPTHYFWKKQEKPFHIDFIFASQAFSERLKTVEVGGYEEWVRFSDHVPLVTKFS